MSGETPAAVLREALDGPPDATLVVRPDGRVVEHSLTTDAVAGDAPVTAEPSTGHSLADLLAPEDGPSALALLAAAAGRGDRHLRRATWNLRGGAPAEAVVLALGAGAESTFVVGLRLPAEPVTPAPVVPAVPEPSGATTVLVVDDEEPNRIMVRRILTRAGFGVVVAAGAAEALAAFEGDGPHPDVLLTDVVLPGLSGKAISDRVRELAPGTAVIYMSGFATMLEHYGVDPDCAAIVAKPLDPTLLVETVKAALTA
jgi:CheY-like chemotaxis protein